MFIFPDQNLTSPTRGTGASIPPLQHSLWTYRWVLALLLLVHLAVGVLRSDFHVGADGAEYLRLAENLLSQGRFTYDGSHPVAGKPPGQPALVASYLALVGSTAGFQILQLLMLFGAYLLTGAFTARLLRRRWALALVAFLVAVDPLRNLADNLIAEPAFLLLNMGGFYALLRLWETHRTAWALAAGTAFALSTYMRPINFFWPLALPLLFWLISRPRWRAGMVVLATHVVLVLPWVIRHAVLFGRFVPMVANWGPFYYMTNEDLFRVYAFEGTVVIRQSADYRRITQGEFQFNWEPNERFRQLAVANIRADPGGYLRRCVRQALFAWTYLPGTKGWLRMAPTAFWLGRFLMLGFYFVTAVGVLALWRHHLFAASLLVGYALYTAFVLFPVTTESRYLIPAYLCLSPLTAAGAARLLATRGLGRVRLHS